jgi:hypothetical protein
VKIAIKNPARAPGGISMMTAYTTLIRISQGETRSTAEGKIFCPRRLAKHEEWACVVQPSPEPGATAACEAENGRAPF